MGQSNTYTTTVDLPVDVSIPSLNTLYKPAKYGHGLYKNETAVKFQNAPGSVLPSGSAWDTAQQYVHLGGKTQALF